MLPSKSWASSGCSIPQPLKKSITEATRNTEKCVVTCHCEKAECKMPSTVNAYARMIKKPIKIQQPTGWLQNQWRLFQIFNTTIMSFQ